MGGDREMGEVLPAKKPWQSKTLWVNLIVAVLAFIPMLGSFGQEMSHEQIGLVAVGLINIFLRLITKGKIELK